VLNKLGAGGVEPVPFFIQWAPDSPHPAQDSPTGCALESIQFWHPEPSALAAILNGLGVETNVTQATVPRLAATLKTPKGPVELK
jgi:hypothetical protein